MSETVQIRIHHGDATPTLIYLPGLHGDWTLIGSFRKALSGRVRFAEVTYPRTLEWTLDEYARGVEEGLAANGISGGWVLAESFGSQIAWPLLARSRLKIEGLILAGGFVRHPMQWGARLLERIVGKISLSFITLILFGYARLARLRYRRSPETLADLGEFIARRTDRDRQAARHRLHLVAESDARPTARNVQTPIYALTGSVDPIVPWILVRPWLRRHCPALREYKIIWRADHNVLSTAPTASVEQVLKWMTDQQLSDLEPRALSLNSQPSTLNNI
jgi:pimeloyl-ACP methyl ester carboxylesterase